jgi:hypothetical protein
VYKFVGKRDIYRVLSYLFCSSKNTLIRKGKRATAVEKPGMSDLIEAT